MDSNDSKYPEILTVFLCFILALLGGVAKELSKAEEEFAWHRFFKNIFVASFCGIIIGLFSVDFEHKNWILAAAAISGLAGISFLDFCVEVLKTVIAKSVAVNIEHVENKKKEGKG